MDKWQRVFLSWIIITATAPHETARMCWLVILSALFGFVDNAVMDRLDGKKSPPAPSTPEA